MSVSAAGRRGLWTVGCVACALLVAAPADAQNRGTYPLGMSATNSGVTPDSGFTYVNQLLFYGRDEQRGPDGEPQATGNNSVILAMNTLVWVGQAEILGGARFSMSATIPLANNSLSSSAAGAISGGGGLGDSYFQPFILGWNFERVAVRAVYGFLAPTGSFEPGANTNVGSGYWTNVVASGQTWRLTSSGATTLSAFQMYEFHTVQQGTGIHPGQTLDLDYSLTHTAVARQRGRTPAWPGRVRRVADDRQDRARRVARRATDPLRGQRHRRRRQRGVAAAEGEPRAQVFRGVRQPLELSGLLHPDCRLDRLLVSRSGVGELQLRR